VGSFLDDFEGSVRVTVGKPDRGYYVDLWEHASEGSLEEAERALSKMKIVNGKPDVSVDTTKYRQLVVFAHLKEWNLDDDGVTWPYTLESVKRLPGKVFNQLWKIVDELDEPETSDDRKRFPGEGGDVDSDGDAGAA
jgi:hypothetical protein